MFFNQSDRLRVTSPEDCSNVITLFRDSRIKAVTDDSKCETGFSRVEDVNRSKG